MRAVAPCLAIILQWETEGGSNISGANGRTCVVTRDDVTAIGGIYCSVYKNGDEKTALATDFHKMTDISDEMELTLTVDSDYYYEESTGNETKQNVTAHIYKFSDGAVGKEMTDAEITALKGTFLHTFKSASTDTELGTKTGKTVSVGQEIWGKITGENEDVNDFLSFTY